MPVSVARFPGVPSQPFLFWQALQPHPKQGFFFGSGIGSPQDHHLYFSLDEPVQSWILNSKLQMTAFERGLKKKMNSSSLRYPRFVGYVGFDAGRFFDGALSRLPSQPHSLQTPVAEFGDYASVVHVDQKKKMTTLFMDARVSKKRKIQLQQKIKKLLASSFSPTKENKKPNNKITNIPSATSYGSMVTKAKQHILEGDIYQANLSLRFSGAYESDPRYLYERLCAKNPSPYACLLKNSDGWIVSSSPELLLDVTGKTVRTRPIAGTRPRGNVKKIDSRIRGQLLLSPKERAEHIMLVDLERNDLGRVCRPGSVHVSERYQVESYSHVMHIVSEVEGILRKNENAFSALKALFPGGTITGCPKIRSIEIIEQLEKKSRGPFYGSAGFFSPNGDAIFNILIRTALIKNKKVYIQAGAGIVADSHPKREYREVLAKAGALLEAIAS